MKNIILIIVTVCFSLLIPNTVYSIENEALDTIIKIEGKVLAVDVTKVTQNYVSFVVPGSDEVYTIERKEVHKIIYKSGRVEEYNPPVVEIIDDYSWEAVWLTEDKKDVADLYKRGRVKAKSAPSSRSTKAAKKNAIIRLQKAAAAKKGVVVLVTRKQVTGGYGEPPGYYIEGIVYGTEPMDEDDNSASDEDDKPLSGGVVL